MRGKNPKPKRYTKFRLLLDSAFAKPEIFKKLKKKAVVKHIRHDFNLSRQAEDEQIYNLAAKNRMFVVTMDFKDFKKFVRRSAPGIIALHSGLSNEEIDTTLSNFIGGKNPDEYYGKAIKL